MTDPATRAERIQNLRNVLRDHGLAEDDGPEAERTIITDHGDGTATVTEVSEDGVTRYPASLAMPTT